MKRVIIFAGTTLFCCAAVGVGIAATDAPADIARVEAACAACHGAAGQGIEARSAPKLAGLDAAYVERQLAHFRQGGRGAGKGDAYGSQMTVIAQSLTDADRRALGARYANMAEVAPVPVIGGNVTRGKLLYESCAACHGANGEGDPAMQAPRLAYQGDWYLLRALDAYRVGARGYDPEDKAGQQMKAMAATLTSDQNTRDVVAYVATLRPALNKAASGK